MSADPDMRIEFWFEFASTYSYPAAMRIERVAANSGVRIDWRAFLLGPIFTSQGWNDSPFNIYGAKGRYMWRDLERLCGELQLPFRQPATFPRSGLLAARIACHFSESAWLPEFVRAVYRANFEHDEDIAAKPTIGKCLAAAGQDPQPIIAAAELPASKEELRLRTEQAVRQGIFGAPSFMVGNELFWGNDRLESAIAWCATHSVRPSVGTITK
jgi:2-hydroxychromene-2-carboxylate isomerase